jgi:hypothetical protein
MDIRIRQNIFLINDKIHNKVYTKAKTVSSGSLAEGLDLAGSDQDIMIIINSVEVIQNVQHMNCSTRFITLLMEYDMAFPGFSRLNLIAEGDHQFTFTPTECFVETINGLFLSNICFIRKLIEEFVHVRRSVHGPCLSEKDETTYITFCFHLHSWPRQAEQWILYVIQLSDRVYNVTFPA